VRRRITQIGTVAFAGVNHQRAVPAEGREHGTARLDRRLEAGYIVAECGAETAKLKKIALHVDDDEGGMGKVDIERHRLGFKADPGHAVPPFGFLQGATAQDRTPSNPPMIV
jgi:hypothetical protein